jgi:hypothetical protein
MNSLTINNSRPKYELNCPWIDNKPEKINFRTTSNTYGNYYNR